MPQIQFDQVDLANKDPRVAIELDEKSGVRQLADASNRVLIVAQKIAAGSQAVNVPALITRPTDGEALFGKGSLVDLMIKAAFEGWEYVQLSAVAVEDANGSTAATATITFANNAAADGGLEVFVMGRKVSVAILKNDTPATIATATAAALNAADLPVSATAAAAVVTVEARNKGPHGNQITLRVRFTVTNLTTTATLNPNTGVLDGGAGVPSLSAALAAVAGSRYHFVALGFDDTTSGGAAKSHVELEGDAEHSKGEVAIQTITGSLATATTLATTLNGARNLVYWLKGTDSLHCEVTATVAATMASQTDPARPFNRRQLRGIKPPAVEQRPTPTERKNAIANGISPITVIPGEICAIRRAVSTRVKDANNNTTYVLLDITTIRSFDYARDNLQLMFDALFGAAKWADDDPQSLLPPDVATPTKVKGELRHILRDLERIGICQHVEALAPQIVVNRVGTNCQFQVPADFVGGLHEVFGKVVLIQTPLA